MMISCATNAQEIRYDVVTKIPGACLHVDIEGTVHKLLEGEMAELIVKLEPSL